VSINGAAAGKPEIHVCVEEEFPMCELDDEVGVAVLGLLAARVGEMALPGMGAFFSGKGVGAVDRMVSALRACFAELRAGADSWFA
jgi:hypothetical protein